MKGITSEGFEYKINDNIKKDYRFIRAYKRIAHPKNDDDAIVAVDDFMEIVLGREGVDRLMKHVEDESGFISIEKMMKNVGEILKHAGKQEETVKNFLSSQMS